MPPEKTHLDSNLLSGGSFECSSKTRGIPAMASVRLAAIVVLLLAGVAGAAPTAEEAVRTFLKLEDRDLYAVVDEQVSARSHPALLAVIEHGEDAVPLLIGALRNDGEWHRIPRRVDLALLAITTGLPADRIRPRGSRRRTRASGSRKAWFRWWQEGRPLKRSRQGVLVPTAVNARALGLHVAASPPPRPGLTTLVREKRVSPAQALEALAKLGSTDRLAALEEMKKDPDRWLPVLLARLDDPRVPASRWLGVGNDLRLMAGLYLASGMHRGTAPDNLRDAVRRALRSGDARLLRAGAVVALRHLDDAVGLIRDRYLEAGEEERDLLLEILDRRGRRLSLTPELRAILEIAIRQVGEPHHSTRSLCRRGLADTPMLLDAWKDTEALRIREILAERGHDFGLALIREIQGTTGLGDLARRHGGLLVAMEFTRLEAETPVPPELHYAAVLRRSLHAGRESATACLPLAVAEDAASLDLLETAAGALDPWTREVAAFCLHARDSKRARLFVRDVVEDRQRSDGAARSWCPPYPPEVVKPPLVPLPPVFELD